MGRINPYIIYNIYNIMNSVEERKRTYININKNNQDRYSIILKAFDNEDLNTDLLNNCISIYKLNKEKKKDNDFEMLILIRILYFINKNNLENNEIIHNTLIELFKEQEFWLKKNEIHSCFWSENHMICYLSSWYLWNQYNNTTNDICNKLLNTFLDVKIKYMYYEFFSQVYNMYTLSALLNIYDFTNNIEIKNKTKQCIEILIQQFSEVITLNGTLFCASGRCYNNYKISSQNNNCNKLLYLITGLCNENGISPVGSFFATSSFKHIQDNNNYHFKYEKIYNISHGQNEFKEIYKNLSKYDRTIFQWSAGNYFNSENIDDTKMLIDDYELWGHSHFKLDPYKTILEVIPKSMMVSTANNDTFSLLTEGSPLCNIKYHIYNNNYYSLTSIENYNKGKLGAQQFPWVANVGGVSVFTQSGKISTIGDLNEVIGNSHLPYIKQQSNIIMAMYNQDDIIKKLISYFKIKIDLNVYLKWNNFDNEFKFVKNNWFFGEKITNNKKVYIAVYSSNGIKLNSVSNDIYNDSDRQGWVAILGDDDEYNSLTTFKDIILKDCIVNFKVLKSKNIFYKYLNLNTSYYGSVSFKNIKFDMKW